MTAGIHTAYFEQSWFFFLGLDQLREPWVNLGIHTPFPPFRISGVSPVMSPQQDWDVMFWRGRTAEAANSWGSQGWWLIPFPGWLEEEWLVLLTTEPFHSSAFLIKWEYVNGTCLVLWDQSEYQASEYPHPSDSECNSEWAIVCRAGSLRAGMTVTHRQDSNRC